jgi:hypothetical protein
MDVVTGGRDFPINSNKHTLQNLNLKILGCQIFTLNSYLAFVTAPRSATIMIAAHVGFGSDRNH